MEEISIFDYIEDNHYRYKKVFPCDHRIRIFEAFAGIGCQRLGAEMLKVPYEVVGISEIDKYAIASYMAMHGDTPNYGDITKMTYIPQCDIFTWSFPCTDLSKAGKRAGLDIGTRSGLVYEVLRLLKATEFKPKVLIMENVPDLVQETFKAQFYEIQKELERYGYKNYTRVLNAKDYGIAQNRERVFMVSILGDEHYEFPIPFKLETRLKDYLEENVDEKYYIKDYLSTTIINEKYFELNGGKWENMHDIGRRVYSTEYESPTIHTMGGGNLEPKIAESTYIQEPLMNYALRSRDYKPNGWNDVAQTLLSRDYKDPKVVMIPNKTICLNSQVNGKQPSLQDRIYDTNGTSTAITTSFMPSIAIGVAQRGRNGKQQIELNNEELSNAITTVQKDSMILIPEATIKGYAEAHDGDGVYINRPEQKRGCVQKGMIQTLKTSCDDVGVVVKDIINPLKGQTPYGWHFEQNVYDDNGSIRSLKASEGSGNIPKTIEGLRIRKLTARECFRLMGITDEYFDRASQVCSNSQLYKQAGNGIVVNVFAEILNGLIAEREEKGE